MENLPTDVIENIFSRLPIKVTSQAKLVSKTWKALLRDYKSDRVGFLFAMSHVIRVVKIKVIEELFYGDEYEHYDHAKMNHYYSYNTLTKIKHHRFIDTTMSFLRDKDVIRLVGSCNGLVCIGQYNKHVLGLTPIQICNPSTGESALLLKYDYSKLPRDIPRIIVPKFPYGSLATGFGYCPSTNHYKVVTIFNYNRESKGHVQVYTVGGEWRYIGPIGRETFNTSSGIYANGALYWLQKDNCTVQGSEIVAAFDLEAENFEYIPLPHSTDFEYQNSVSPLKLLGGNHNVYLVHTRDSCIDIWVYKRNYASTGSSYTLKECNLKQNYHDRSSSYEYWIKGFSIQLEKAYCFKPFAITRSNEVLLWYSYHAHFGTRLYCYDPKTSTLYKLWNDKKRMKCVHNEAIPHTWSIVSLKDLEEANVTSLKGFSEAMKVKSGGAEKFPETSNRSRDAKRKKTC